MGGKWLKQTRSKFYVYLKTTDVEELILVKPPQRTDSCVDLTENSCKVIVIEDPTVCNVPGISHFACRQTCGTCGKKLLYTTIFCVVQMSGIHFSAPSTDSGKMYRYCH